MPRGGTPLMHFLDRHLLADCDLAAQLANYERDRGNPPLDRWRARAARQALRLQDTWGYRLRRFR